MTRRMAPLAAAAVLGVLALLPVASPAAATGGIPADCATGRPPGAGYTTLSLTCTNRPAGQQWHLHVFCMGGWVDLELDGNVVTGNGTSTLRCPHAGMPSGASLVVD